MKKINKLTEPHSLTNYRSQPFSSYANMPSHIKDEIKQQLIDEQGGICCYCMSRIPKKIDGVRSVQNGMKLEHYKSQATHINLELSYSNMLGSCLGNEGKPKHLQTCDTKKGQDNIIIDPTSVLPNCDTIFKYTGSGEIRSTNNNIVIDEQINSILNLNTQTLKDNRSEIYNLIRSFIKTESYRNSDKSVRISALRKEKEKWSSRTDNQYNPFCMVAIYLLNKAIIQNT